MTERYVPLPDSRGTLPPRCDRGSRIAPSQVVEVSMVLKTKTDTINRLAWNLHALPPGSLRQLSYAEVETANSFGDGLDPITSFADNNNLELGPVDPLTGTVTLKGRVDDINRAFNVDLYEYQHERDGELGKFRGYEGEISLPTDVASQVEGVAGLSTKPFVQPRIYPRRPAPVPTRGVQGFAIRDIVKTYGVPTNAKASHQKIAIIELGGGYTREDMEAFCTASRIEVPKIVDHSVDGARNRPTGRDGTTRMSSADGEVALDMQICAAAAPGAELHMYFAPNTDKGFIDAVSAAVRDGCTAISISWGGPESDWPPAVMQAFDRACQAAVTMGISVFAASGDDGYTDGVKDGKCHADFPATSPHVVACGGTTLPNLDRSKESRWDESPYGGASGGGVSDFWPVPPFQKGLTLPASANDGAIRRTIPDAVANAASRTGWRTFLNGQWYSVGGTSAVAPFLASIHALQTEDIQRNNRGAKFDFLSVLYKLWGSDSSAMQPVQDRGTGPYKVTPGYNAAVGWGSPNYFGMLNLLRASLGLRPRAVPAPTRPTPDRGLAA